MISWDKDDYGIFDGDLSSGIFKALFAYLNGGISSDVELPFIVLAFGIHCKLLSHDYQFQT